MLGKDMLGKEDKFVIFGPIEKDLKKSHFIRDYLNLIGKNELSALTTAKLEYVVDLFDYHKNVDKKDGLRGPNIYPIGGESSFRSRESPFKIPRYDVIKSTENYTKIRFKKPHMPMTIFYEPRKTFEEDLIEKEDKFIISGTLEQTVEEIDFIINCLNVIGENNLKEVIRTLYKGHQTELEYVLHLYGFTEHIDKEHESRGLSLYPAKERIILKDIHEFNVAEATKNYTTIKIPNKDPMMSIRIFYEPRRKKR